MYLDPQAVLESAQRHLGNGPFVHEQLPGGASLRRFHRLKGRAPGASIESVIVMELGPEAHKPEEITAGAAPTEIPFLNVQRYLATGGIGVPNLLGRDEEKGLLFVEDLGDQTLEAAVKDASDAERARYYEAAIAELVRLQRYASEHPDPSCVAFGRSFDRALLRWELDHFREYGIDAQQIALTAIERATMEAAFDRLADELAALPRLLVHRDYQSRNLMVQEGARGAAPKIRVVDFQDALLGPYIYDLVGLLRDSYVVLSPSLLGQLVEHFATLSQRSVEETQLHFAMQTVQRKLKDAGRFVFIDRVKKNPSFLRHIPSSIRYVRDALLRLDELGVREYRTIAELLESKAAQFSSAT